MLIVDMRVVQHSLFRLGAVRVYAHVHDDHYLTRSKFNSLLTEMITPQTYKYNTSGDENHLCGASLRQSHKISLKAHRYACSHGVGTPIARPERLPQQ